MEKEKLPEHLKSLKTCVDDYYIGKPDESAYAEVAFALLKCAEGDKGAISEVRSYIQRQHLKAKNDYERDIQLKNNVNSWLSWATIWTTHKTIDGALN